MTANPAFLTRPRDAVDVLIDRLRAAGALDATLDQQILKAVADVRAHQAPTPIEAAAQRVRQLFEFDRTGTHAGVSVPVVAPVGGAELDATAALDPRGFTLINVFAAVTIVADNASAQGLSLQGALEGASSSAWVPLVVSPLAGYTGPGTYPFVGLVTADCLAAQVRFTFRAQAEQAGRVIRYALTGAIVAGRRF